MEALHKRWFQRKKKRQRQAPDKKSRVKKTQNSQLPPTATPGEDSGMSNGETTGNLLKPQDDQTTCTPIKEQSSTTSADNEKRLKDMPSEGQKKLIHLLQPKDLLGNDYRRLADKLGYPNDYIKYLESTDEPVKTLLKEIGNMKIVELIPMLEDMGRKDVAEELEEILKSTSTPEDIAERAKIRENNKMTTREHYDAFICFGENDRQFVELLTEKMEGDPYHLLLCLSKRDFLPGGSIYDITAEAIIERCSKSVVVLSTNFENSNGAYYESQIAMSLSPGAKQKRFIPILIEEDYRGKIPLTLSHIVYLDFLRLEEDVFWKKLAISLGWNPNKVCCDK